MGQAWDSAWAQLRLNTWKGCSSLGFAGSTHLKGGVKSQVQAWDLRLGLVSSSEIGGSTHH